MFCSHSTRCPAFLVLLAQTGAMLRAEAAQTFRLIRTGILAGRQAEWQSGRVAERF